MEIMYKDTVVANMEDSPCGQFKQFTLVEGVEEYKIPRELFFECGTVDMLQFLKWLKRRIFPRDRVDIQELLGGRQYRVLEIAKETNASLATDDYWVRFKKGENFEDTVRGYIYNYYK